MNDVMASAIVAVCGKLTNLPKTATARIATKTGAGFTYSYAPLPDVLDLVRPVLNAHGLALLQHIEGIDGRIGVETLLIHESGAIHDAGCVSLPATDPKDAGSVVTYLRRYAICALFGIAGDDDLDASVTSAASVQGKDAAADMAGGDSAKTTSPPATTRRYPLADDPAKCTHRYPSGNWLPWDDQDRCPKCGMRRIDAIEGTTADLGAAT